MRTLGSLPLLSNERPVVLDTIAQLLHDIYSGDKWVDPVLPDLLGEHVVQRAVSEEPTALFDAVLGQPT